MSNLVVIAFKDELKADEVLLALKRMQQDYLIDLEDAAIVVRNKEGKVKIEQTHNLAAGGAIRAGFGGILRPAVRRPIGE